MMPDASRNNSDSLLDKFLERGASATLLRLLRDDSGFVPALERLVRDRQRAFPDPLPGWLSHPLARCRQIVADESDNGLLKHKLNLVEPLLGCAREA
jgi:hypothetical protein